MAAALVVGSQVVELVPSAEEVPVDGVVVHGHQDNHGPVVPGQAGGTVAIAPSLTGLAGPVEAGARLPRGLHGLAALLRQRLPALSQPPAVMVLLTPQLVSATNSLKPPRPAPALRPRHQPAQMVQTALPLQVALLSLLSWALLPCYKLVLKGRKCTGGSLGICSRKNWHFRRRHCWARLSRYDGYS